MAVYERTYRGYVGPTTDPRTRSLVLARYAFEDIFASRLFLGFFLLCFVWPLACAVVIYLKYNVDALTILDLSAIDLIPIDATFFRLGVVRPQSLSAFLLIMLVGPALISPDLRNNAMPLYLSRPLNRTDYVLGKFVVVASLALAVTVAPALILFALQSYLGGGEWFAENYRIAPAMVVSFAVWTLCCRRSRSRSRHG